jgi:D-alanyl-D-alanine carboxypeptidase
VTGLKTGNTLAAGRTAVYLASREGETLIVVILGAKNQYDLDLSAAKLFDYGFNRTQNLSAVEINSRQLASKYSSWNNN